MPTNYALTANGGTATASSTYGSLLPARANDGYRHTNNDYDGGLWFSATGTTPHWLQIDFSAPRAIDQIDVFLLADAGAYNTDPSLADTFTNANGATAFTVAYWNGAAWVTIASVTGNNKVWRRFVFAEITTSKIRITITASGSGYGAIVEVEAWSAAPPLLPVGSGCELYIEPQKDARGSGAANGQNAAGVIDYSGEGRNLATSSNYPIYQIPSANGRAAILWDGTKNPLKNNSVFEVRCGFMVVRVNEPTFSNFAGILTDTLNFPILVGKNGTRNFYDNLQSAYYYEFRSNDRIYPAVTAPAPMQEYKIIFFRYWRPVTLNGIQIGQDRTDAARKAKISVALLALYSRDFCESDIRAHLENLAAAYSLPLGDVFPFYLDNSSMFRKVQAANMDFPTSGGMIAETLSGILLEGDLKFAVRQKKDVENIVDFVNEHYGESGFILRLFAFQTPHDYAGYATSLVEFSADGRNASFGFREDGANGEDGFYILDEDGEGYIVLDA